MDRCATTETNRGFNRQSMYPGGAEASAGRLGRSMDPRRIFSLWQFVTSARLSPLDLWHGLPKTSGVVS
jgi:hypothetical protein